MNGKKTKQLKKTLLKKAEETLFLLRMEYGSQTEKMTPTCIWKNFKRMYKNGKVPQAFLVSKSSYQKK